MTNTNIRDNLPPEKYLVNLPLWEPQKEAVLKMRNYISAFNGGDVNKAALVHMPTGSGKTGVIAVLARCVPEINCTLILTPRIALRNQLSQDIKNRFFEHLNPPPEISNIPKTVIEITNTEQLQKIQDFSSSVLISTIQMIYSMSKLPNAEWEELIKHIDLVIIDEGHCEPASSWSQAIRSFNAPKIVFTATPFRNDLKVFDIDTTFLYSYTFHNALQDHLLRSVEFIPMKATKDPNQFIDDLLEFYDKKFGNSKEDKPRVIIRCDHSQEIRQIKAVLEDRQRNCIAIHETFSDRDDDPNERKHVPIVSNEEQVGEGVDPIFWIHQYKLQEGIDDPRFQILAPFESLTDGRALVQQIGRIIRNPTHDPLAKGYVLDYSNGRQRDLWERYLKYDEALTLNGVAAFNLATGSGWLANIFDSQPILTYLKYRFRTPLEFEKINPRQDLILPRMVNLYNQEVDFSFKQICELLELAYQEEDRLFHRYDQGDAVIYLYVAFNNSPLLENSYFIEPKLGITYLREMKSGEGDLLAYYDSLGNLPIDYKIAGLGKPVKSYQMKKLFSNHVKSCLTNVSLRNSNLGTIAIRSRAISAANIQETVSAFDDYAQICTNVTGYSLETQAEEGNNRRLRRYLGFQRGRISEASGRIYLDEYEKWLSNIVGTIHEPRNPHPTFQRYAKEGMEVHNSTPMHILLDISEVEDSFETIGDDAIPAGQPLEIEDLAQEITRGMFDISANGKSCRVSIEYIESSHRYKLESRDLDMLYCRKVDQTDNRDLISYLNQEQSFRVIPEENDLIYTLGEFYSPLFKVGKDFDSKLFEVSQILVPVPLLENIEDEKGVPITIDGWEDDTLFGIIDNLGRPKGRENAHLFDIPGDMGSYTSLKEYFGDPDILVCDDMGTESADFIMADFNNRRVAFIHAKASSSRKPASASALQEVIGQATKNLNFLGMFNQTTPKNLPRWDEPWNNRGSIVTKRIRLGPQNGTKAWQQIHSIIRHPLADREVWLFMGQTLSKSKFEKMLSQEKPGAEALQAAYLLFATLSNVASVGAKLRVFCYP